MFEPLLISQVPFIDKLTPEGPAEDLIMTKSVPSLEKRLRCGRAPRSRRPGAWRRSVHQKAGGKAYDMSDEKAVKKWQCHRPNETAWKDFAGKT